MQNHQFELCHINLPCAHTLMICSTYCITHEKPSVVIGGNGNIHLVMLSMLVWSCSSCSSEKCQRKVFVLWQEAYCSLCPIILFSYHVFLFYFGCFQEQWNFVNYFYCSVADMMWTECLFYELHDLSASRAAIIWHTTESSEVSIVRFFGVIIELLIAERNRLQ